ncbi:MAG: hypothetical protein ACPGSL_02505 [Vicingaceae bacterium]
MMKRPIIVLSVLLTSFIYSGCSKDKDCVCVTTNTEDGVVVSSSTTTHSLDSDIPGPLGILDSEDCDDGDSYSSNSTNYGASYIYETECELE